MRKLILLLAALVSSSIARAETIEMKVYGLVCAFCAQGIEKKMRSLTQTKDVYVDLKNRVVAVELKDGQTLSHDAFKAIIKDAGYDVAKIEHVGNTAQQIKASLRDKK